MNTENKNEIYKNAFNLTQRNLWLDTTNNVFNMKEDKLAVIVFESLKKAINKNIIKQIEDLKNPKRCVLLIDGDYNLISGIVSYVYYVHGCGRLHHVPCSVLNEKDIESWLYWSDEWCLNPNSPLIKFIKGETLFLRDLNSEYQHILKRIAWWIRDLPIDKYGMLIISMDNVIDLPEDFKEQFEVIGLDPEKQDKDADTPPSIEKEKQVDRLFYTWNKNKIVLFLNKNTSPVYLTKQETKLFGFLLTDRRTIEEIAGEIWEAYRFADIKNATSNIGELRRRINKKCERLVPGGIISELDNDCYYLTIEVEEEILSNSKLRK